MFRAMRELLTFVNAVATAAFLVARSVCFAVKAVNFSSFSFGV